MGRFRDVRWRYVWLNEHCQRPLHKVIWIIAPYVVLLDHEGERFGEADTHLTTLIGSSRAPIGPGRSDESSGEAIPFALLELLVVW